MAPKPQEDLVNGVSITLKKEEDNRTSYKNGFINNAFYGDGTKDNGAACIIPSASTTTEKAKAVSTSSSSDPPSMDFDDLLPHIGEFGLYQKILFLLMIPFAFSVAFVYFTQIFITLVPDEHWCNVPELQHLSREDRLVTFIYRYISKCILY